MYRFTMAEPGAKVGNFGIWANIKLKPFIPNYFRNHFSFRTIIECFYLLSVFCANFPSHIFPVLNQKFYINFKSLVFT